MSKTEKHCGQLLQKLILSVFIVVLSKTGQKCNKRGYKMYKIAICLVLLFTIKLNAFPEINDKFLIGLAIVESGNDPNVKPGDGGRAIGVYQIHKIYVREANRLLKLPVFDYSLRSDPRASRYMVKVVLPFWARYHEKRGYKIDYPALVSLHRHPCAAWTPKYMDCDLERDRTKKILNHMKN
jgi:hypothetical protein